jgi:pre-mRNA-processing factor 19
MSALVCALSNEIPEQPVISPVSGHVYEKRLILKYINESGTDPMSNQALSVEQLIDVKSSALVKPKAPSATSIPSLLKSLQDEWDSVMLHSFTLRQQLQTARQELSHALYQHDAACRVIARLTKEVTAAREALSTLKPHIQTNIANNNNVTQTMYAAETQHQFNGDQSQNNTTTPTKQQQQQQQQQEGISEQVALKLQEKSASLTVLRKQRGKKLPEELANVDTIRSYTCTSSHTGLHSATTTGITCLDVKLNNSDRCVTGGNDKNAIVFSASSEQIVATLKGHTKKLTQVIYHPEDASGGDTVITASADSTIRIWSVAQQQQIQFLKIHDGSVTGLSLHPLGDYVLSCSVDEHWAFSDLRTGKCLIKVSSQEGAMEQSSSASSSTGSCSLTCAKFHPDGLIFGTGTADSVIKIWDLKSKTNLANFPGHTGSITALSFSENGYYLATASEDSLVKLWDLRKLKNFKTIEFDSKYEIKDLVFDYSGCFLACAGTDVRVYQSKQWDLLRTFADHTNLATSVRFGQNAKSLVSSSLDKSLKFYSLPK